MFSTTAHGAPLNRNVRRLESVAAASQGQRYNRGHHRSKSSPSVSLPPFTETGDLPQGVHRATLQEVLDRLGQAPLQRKLVATRLKRVYELAAATGAVKRFIVFGSFVTAKSDPNDVDVFLVMHDTFDFTQVTGESRLVFDHPAAQAHFGASIFWLRQLAALPSEEESVTGWQLKRGGTRRGIVELKEA